MNLIRTRVIAALLAMGLLTLAPVRTRAQTTTLSFALTATYQNPSPKQTTTDNGDVTTTSTLTAKLTSSTLQGLISTNLGISLTGYELIWDQNADVLGETNKAGDFHDASSIITINTDASGSGELVTSGTSDTIDQISQSLSTTSDWNVTFDDGKGNSFNVSGLVKLTAGLAAPTKSQGTNGLPQTETINFSGSVAGFGTVVDKQGNTDAAVFSGTVSGTGKGPAGS
jgi:hypothetical protein